MLNVTPSIDYTFHKLVSAKRTWIDWFVTSKTLCYSYSDLNILYLEPNTSDHLSIVLIIQLPFIPEVNYNHAPHVHQPKFRSDKNAIDR